MEWDAVYQKAIDELKARFMKQPILTMVDTMKELHIKSDASDFATGAVLSMKCDDNKWHPCAYLSKGLNDVKQNYDTHDKEMFRIMRALESWRYYLEGAKEVRVLCQGHLLIEGHKELILVKIRKSKDLDELVIKAVEKLKKSSTRQL